MRRLLFTSIPPRLRGVCLDQGGADSPQRRAIASWIAAGFQPVSINLDREIAAHPQLPDQLLACGVETMVISPRTPVLTTLPLCSFADFLLAIEARAEDAPVAIINADIRLAASAESLLATHIANLSNNDYLIAQRTDIAIDLYGHRQEVIHAHGFDLIAFHPHWLRLVAGSLAPSLTFGLPWWDHYLPLALTTCGAHTRLLDARWCEHDAHDTKWSWAHYRRVGGEAALAFRSAVEPLTDCLAARAWLHALEWESMHPALPERLAPSVWRAALPRRAPRWLAMHVLGRLAAANVRLILQSATSGPLPGDA